MSKPGGFKYDVQGAYLEFVEGGSLIYGVDWTKYLSGLSGVTIAASIFTSEPAVVAVSALDIVGGICRFRLSGGVGQAGQTVWVRNTITLSDMPAQMDSRDFRVKVVARKSVLG